MVNYEWPYNNEQNDVVISPFITLSVIKLYKRKAEQENKKSTDDLERFLLFFPIIKKENILTWDKLCLFQFEYFLLRIFCRFFRCWEWKLIMRCQVWIDYWGFNYLASLKRWLAENVKILRLYWSSLSEGITTL